MTISVDTRLSLQQWVALNCIANMERGPLTPLIFEYQDDSAVAALASERASPPAALLAESSPVLERLADPQAVNGLTFVLPDQIVDMAVYYSRSRIVDETVSLTDEGGSLRLQSPAPIDEVLSLLQIQLSEARAPVSPVKLDMPVLPAWLCWAFIDLLREAIKAGGAVKQEAYGLEMVLSVLGRPFELFNNLGAYFRQALDLDLPGDTDILAALNQLAEKGLITRTNEGYQPGDLLRQQALEFSDLQAHLLIRTNALLANGSPASMRNWIFQGKSGNGLLWHEVQGNIRFIGLSRDRIIAFVESLVKDPLHFFAEPKHKPAPPESLPLADMKRKPPPPEKLR